MKHTRIIWAFALCVLATLAACNKKDDVTNQNNARTMLIGTWQGQTISFYTNSEASGKPVSQASAAHILLTFNDDGTASSEYDDDVETFDWELNDDIITLKDGPVMRILKLDEKDLTVMDMESDEDGYYECISFSRVSTDGGSDSGDSEIVGLWRCDSTVNIVYCEEEGVNDYNVTTRCATNNCDEPYFYYAFEANGVAYILMSEEQVAAYKAEGGNGTIAHWQTDIVEIDGSTQSNITLTTNDAEETFLWAIRNGVLYIYGVKNYQHHGLDYISTVMHCFTRYE